MSRKWYISVPIVAASAFAGLRCVSNPAVVRDESRSVKQSNPVQVQSSPTSQSATAGGDVDIKGPDMRQIQGVSGRELFGVLVAYMAYDLLKDLGLGRWIKNGRAKNAAV